MFILITGASRGIGFEMVKKFSKDSNNLIIAVSRNTAPLLKYINDKNAHNVLAFKADITKSSDQKKIVRTIKSLHLPLDILINNAGELVKKPFEKITEKELRSVYNANVFAPFLLVQALLPYLNKKTPAHIINIGSMGGVQGSAKFSGLSAYSSSKGALAVLTECLAEELKHKGIRVNCLALGAVQTEMLSRAFPGYRAPTSAKAMAEFICRFASSDHHFFNGKILPVSSSTP